MQVKDAFAYLHNLKLTKGQEPFRECSKTQENDGARNDKRSNTDPVGEYTAQPGSWRRGGNQPRSSEAGHQGIPRRYAEGIERNCRLGRTRLRSTIYRGRP